VDSEGGTGAGRHRAGPHGWPRGPGVMFVGWRDLRFATGRFALMGAVVVLVTVLVGLLSGLTAGLARQNTSAILDLPADRIVLAAPGGDANPSFADSVLDGSSWARWSAVEGVRSAEPLGIATVRAGGEHRSVALAAFGVRPGSGLSAAAPALGDGRVVLSEDAAAELAAAAGDRVRIAGRDVVVARVAGSDYYSHLPVIWTDLADWQWMAGVDRAPRATAIALSTAGGEDLPGRLAAADRAIGTTTVERADAVRGIGSYAAENGSLQMVRGFLYAICALVVGAFFSIWTIQRGPDIAVLKALGASTAVLLRDAVAQAAVLLGVGVAVGSALVVGIGSAIAAAVPFVLDATTVLLPAATIVAVGTAGAAVAVRRLVRVDPLAALGGAR
jgi:putative ABC transport system permease protein